MSYYYYFVKTDYLCNHKAKEMQNSSPIAEVFGFPVSNETRKAKYYRENRLCPFHNRFPNCTKDKADDPLGVCSVNHGDNKVITCPSRFREDWKILHNAAEFVWPKGTRWISLPEIKLVDANGQSAGNVDYVIVSYNEEGQITDFASIEVQGVYISANLRNPFQQYMKSPSADFAWNGKFRKSQRKRLISPGFFMIWNIAILINAIIWCWLIRFILNSNPRWSKSFIQSQDRCRIFLLCYKENWMSALVMNQKLVLFTICYETRTTNKFVLRRGNRSCYS